MGMNHAGEIAALARIAAPDWGVVTNVGTAHIENFADGQAGIARAKFELVAALPANGVAFLNCDDAYVSQFGRDFPGRVVYFGDGPCADPQILSASPKISRGLHVRYRAGEREGSFTLHLLGAHNASNAMAGLAVALEAGVDLDAAVAALAIAHRRRQARPGDRDRRRHHSQRQLQLQPRGAALHDPHPGRAARRGPPHSGGRRDAGAGRARPRAARRLRPRRRRGRPRSRRRRSGQRRTPGHRRLRRRRRLASFFPTPKPPASGSRRICAPATWCWSKARAAFTWSAPSKSFKDQTRTGGGPMKLHKTLRQSRAACSASARRAQSPLPLAQRPIPPGPRPFRPSASPAISITSAAKTSRPISSSRRKALILINSSLESSCALDPEERREPSASTSATSRFCSSATPTTTTAPAAPQIIKLTGAKYYVMDADVPVVESGGETDFHYGAEPDDALSRRRTSIACSTTATRCAWADTVLTAHLTAGPHQRHHHLDTRRTAMAGRSRMLHVVIVGSPNVNPGYKLVEQQGVSADRRGLQARIRGA